MVADVNQAELYRRFGIRGPARIVPEPERFDRGCPTCAGTPGRVVRDREAVTCPTCNGLGLIRNQERLFAPFFDTTEEALSGPSDKEEHR